jgi:hypothetical protein
MGAASLSEPFFDRSVLNLRSLDACRAIPSRSSTALRRGAVHLSYR